MRFWARRHAPIRKEKSQVLWRFCVSLFAFKATKPTIDKAVDLAPEHRHYQWDDMKGGSLGLCHLFGHFSKQFGRQLCCGPGPVHWCYEDKQWLLKSMKGYLAIMDAHQNFLFNCKRRSQDQSMMEEYMVKLMLWADTIKYHGGSSVENFKLADAISPNGELRSWGLMKNERAPRGTRHALAMALIWGADPTWYGMLIVEHSS
jgi:hypothetical protein